MSFPNPGRFQAGFGIRCYEVQLAQADLDICVPVSRGGIQPRPHGDLDTGHVQQQLARGHPSPQFALVALVLFELFFVHVDIMFVDFVLGVQIREGGLDFRRC